MEREREGGREREIYELLLNFKKAVVMPALFSSLSLLNRKFDTAIKKQQHRFEASRQAYQMHRFCGGFNLFF